ncbi:PHD-finger domain [Tubulinosema ratisbonensis]|uniref:PHD-finger domain n=1 Tax=Tubulinosema ratisbonensis TaxID=291195 RepID=A0A437AL98_9MICR|nr:PHD-finger domain [Tubulinosema ratisbonensis]
MIKLKNIKFIHKPKFLFYKSNIKLFLLVLCMHKTITFVESLFDKITKKRSPNLEINQEWYKELAQLIKSSSLKKLIIGYYTEKSIFIESYILLFSYKKSCKKEIFSFEKLEKMLNNLFDLPTNVYFTLRIFHTKKKLLNFKNEKENFVMNGNEENICKFLIKMNEIDCFIELKIISCFCLKNESFYLNLLKEKEKLGKIHRKENQKIKSQEKIFDSQLTFVNTKLTNIFLKKDADKANINCICGINIEDGDMLFCDGCCSWSHTVCCGFFSNTDKRIPKNDYYCFFCIRRNKFLSQDKCNYHDQKRLALYRRVLSVIYNEGVNNSILLSRRLGISYRNGVNFINQLIYDGFLTKKEKRFVIQKNEEIKKRLKEYFTVIGGELI